MNKILSTAVLFLVSIYHLYDQFAPDKFGLSDFSRRMYGNFYLAAFFFFLGVLSFKFSSNRIFQWVTIVSALLWAGGGFLGFGWIAAIILGLIYIVAGKNSSVK